MNPSDPSVDEQPVESADVADSAVPLEPDEQEAVGAQPAADGAEPTGDGAEAEPPDPVAEAQRQRDEYLDHLRRERAEFENFRKRATRERMEALDRGAEQVMNSLLHVLDTFGLALTAAESSDDDQLAKGVQMVHAELVSTLHNLGLTEVEGVGNTFDPMHHEAMMQVEADEPVDEPVVVEVLRPGYRFKGRVLRPASVKVAK
ncbi:MAG TPA: nucleotide exchange factor GrpE [Egibacteraceae bacterium]|nr:nucleotide exchange factor GrpE [Egibacteraceae bacterium]